MDHGFIKDDRKEQKKMRKVVEKEVNLPIKENECCTFCGNPRIDNDVLLLFNKRICFDCKFSKLRLITKTTVLTKYLLTNEEISELRYLSKPNPKKGTWHDMQLFDADQIEKIAIRKYGSLENVSIEREKRKNALLSRKKQKVRTRIKELRKKTLIEDKLKTRNHQHNFIPKDGKMQCECGMVIESEEI